MVNAEAAASGQEAPGALEDVRELLNTWLIPNDTRLPTDRFADYRRARALTRSEGAALGELRDVLRAAVQRDPGAEEQLNAWIGRVGIRPVLGSGVLGFVHDGSACGALLADVLDAVGAGRWERLKACPDCRWVFYDHTRNGGKRWCQMYAGGPDGRACGTIAKVRTHRANHPSVSVAADRLDP
jgi:hypothetical protein